VFRVFFRKKINIIVLSILAILIIFSYVYPAIIHYDVNVDPYINLMDSTAKHLKPAAAMAKFGPNLKWILGAGGAGESTFDAIWYGSSISISLALVCAAINMTVGVAVGAVWGFSKKVDIFMTEVYNVIANVPYVLLISVIVLVMSASFWSMVFALTVTGWIAIAYFIRTQVIIIRDREYNLASRCLGTPITRIATKNILPFMTSVIVTLVATEIPSYISYEVFLSYIGMGLKDMSLGKLIQAAQSAMVTPGWEIEFWSPVAVASIIAVVLYIVGQNLGDASDPRTHM
jgi:oligopeptide transport system permease protein